jgi:hypothetical protein
MIPHHLIAIMTRAHIRDPRVRKLADGIIESQVREIAGMKNLIADLEKKPLPDDAKDLPARPAELSGQIRGSGRIIRVCGTIPSP